MKNPCARRRKSRGQALVELMLFFPLLVFMVVGSTDISTLLDDHLAIVYAARAAARVGSVMGNNQYADCAIIGAVQAALASNRDVTLNQITIYQATKTGAIATNGSSQPLEDVYPGSAMCVSTSPSSGTISVSATVANWPPGGACPACRDATPFTEQSIGVKLDYTYQFEFTPLGGGTFTSSDYAVMPIEVVINQNATPTPTP
ncbi:MAG TPA: TadE/TadG family type IV pilus assembly protein [Ktedonobacterales bacterium]|nr:TadE/TadG family type IV pilus assembly protein [Ktedonobacterales bacterium]